MKQLQRYLNIVLLIIVICSVSLNAQVEERTKSVVTKNDGTEYVGFILKQDARGILLQTGRRAVHSSSDWPAW
jgi:lipopolysaccharide export system protein LptC